MGSPGLLSLSEQRSSPSAIGARAHGGHGPLGVRCCILSRGAQGGSHAALRSPTESGRWTPKRVTCCGVRRHRRGSEHRIGSRDSGHGPLEAGEQFYCSVQGADLRIGFVLGRSGGCGLFHDWSPCHGGLFLPQRSHRSGMGAARAADPAQPSRWAATDLEAGEQLSFALSGETAEQDTAHGEIEQH
jgi:hypothetical protein